MSSPMYLAALCLVLVASPTPVPAAQPDADMVWFRTNHAQVDRFYDTDGFTTAALYADGEYRGASCGDTIPVAEATTLELGGQRFVVPAGGWRALSKTMLQYSGADGRRVWRLGIDLARGAWWLAAFDAEPAEGDTTLAVSLRFNEAVGREAIALEAVTTSAAVTAYYRAPTAPMACFHATALDADQTPQAKDGWTSHVHLQGVYAVSDCHQARPLTAVGAILRVGGASLHVPVGGFKPAEHDWFTYSAQTDDLTWWLSVHPRSGVFWAYVWSRGRPLATGGGGLKLRLQVGDQVGEETLAGLPQPHPHHPSSQAVYHYKADPEQACPRL
ncbi:MAG TPA: hypothetical protein VFH51_15245 [Myxococcota bacterium]|nr:hypothetical protein [Myxococcota bacterium]